MNIEIWSLGKENEGFINDGLNYYFKKTMPYCPVSLHLLQVPKKAASTHIDFIKQSEEELILKKLQAQHYLVLLDETGKLLDSPQWAKQFEHCMNSGVRTLVILIGGAYGVTATIKQKAKQIWSLSNLVFPHQLVRLIAAEQVYRAFSIIHHSPYHHA